MSSRPLVITGIVGGILAGIVLCAVGLTLVASDGAALSAQVMATLMLGVALGVVLDATWLTFVVAQLAKLDHGGEGGDGDGGQRRRGPGPVPEHPGPPSEGPDWWPEFERDLRAHIETDTRAPVAG